MMGKSHLATALAHAACLRGHRVRFAAAIDIVNRLSAAESNRQLARELKHYQSPELLLIDERGYLPLVVWTTTAGSIENVDASAQ